MREVQGGRIMSSTFQSEREHVTLNDLFSELVQL